MLPLKDVLRIFRAPPWGSQADIDAFADEVGAMPAGDVLKLLSNISEKNLVLEGPPHRLRCAAFGAIVERSTTPELFVPLVKALKTADPQMRAQLVTTIPRVNDPANHGELCALVGSPDPDLRRIAAQVLKPIVGKTALAALSESIRDAGFAGRIEAMEVVCPKAAHHSLPLLSAVLEKGKFQEKIAALRYMGDAKLMARDTPAAAAAITPALRDADERVIAQALMSLAQVAAEDEYLSAMGALVDSTNTAIVRAMIEGVRRFPSRRMVDILTRKMRMGPHPIRMLVLESLEAIGTPDVLGPVLDALSHPNLHVRMRASQVLTNLGQQGKIEVAQCVIWLLRSRDVNLRRVAVELARSAGEKGADLMPRLLKLLRDEDFWIRERVMDALVEIAGNAITRHVAEYLSDPSDVVRRYAIRAIVKVNDPRAIGALVRVAQNDADWWVREQAIEGIGQLKDERAVPYIVDLMQKHEDLRLACLLALRTMGARKAAPYVAQLSTSEAVDLRIAVVQALDAFDAREEVEVLRGLSQDADPRVKLAARDCLSRWNIEDVVGVTADKSMSLLDRMLLAMVKAEADDLIVGAGRTPFIKRHGRISPLSQTVFSHDQVKAMLYPAMSAEQREQMSSLRDVDFSYEVRSHRLRFRVNVFTQSTGIASVFRIVKNDIPDLAKLGLPPIMHTFANLKNGLVLVGGPTGSGKSTTLAALIDHINRNDARHIVTIEDPIEVQHTRIKSLINQREVGTHTLNFLAAMRSTLRQDPDVILVGEMRDLATIQFAVTAAETGHLVFGTVHTVSADTSVDRLINAFPAAQQPQVRAMLAESLRAVACQHLLRRKDGPGRALAVEVLLNNDAVSNLIRKAKTFQIPSVITTSKDAGMQSMDGELLRLVREGKVDQDEAFMKANDKKAFENMLSGQQGQKKDQPARP